MIRKWFRCILPRFGRKLTILPLVACLLLLACFGEGCRQEHTEAQIQETKKFESAQSPLLEQLSGKIAFHSDRDGDWEIYVMNIDGSNVTQLTHNTDIDGYPTWSPNGAKIAFKSNRDGNFEIYVMNANGSDQRNLTKHPSNDEDPAWSPDGSRIAFDSDRISRQEIFIMNADGTGLEQFTNAPGRNRLAAWSPDGKWIAYTGNRYLGWNVYRKHLETGEDERLTGRYGANGACRPDWSPDGSKIAYVSMKNDKKGDIWAMNPNGDEKIQLTFTASSDYYPEWSPDGQYIAYASSPEKQGGNWEINVMSADGAQHVRITDHSAQDKLPNWIQ